MEKVLSYEEAKTRKSFYVIGVGFINHKNFYDLIKDIELASFIGVESNRRIYPHNALAYYVNNVVSIDGPPKRVGSFACDISYRVTNDTKQDLSELIGFIINEMRYFNYYDEEEVRILVTQEIEERKVELFINRLEMWFGCIMKDGRKLPRGRRID